MVVKFFSNKKGGSSKAINYLLNEREKEGTARVLQGDPNLTRQIINNIRFKQKTTVGCLSFEEKNISEKMKYELMADFEKHLLPGMQDRYNILWVEHTDKGRLELNFVIPKIDLETQKSLNPYYHKADLPRVEKWQDLQNLKYNYSSPKDPSKTRTLQTDSKQIGLSKDYEQLDKLLHNLTQEGKINNREQLIELLQSNSIEVTRKGKDYLSIKLPDSKKAKKFKGSIYDEKFTSIGAVREISTRAREEVKQYNSRDTQRELERLNADLKSYTQTKEREHRKKYPIIRKEVRSRSEHINREPNRVAQNKAQENRNYDRGQTGEREHTQANINSNNNIHINDNDSISDSMAYHQQTVQSRAANDILFLHDRTQQGEINDSIGTTVNARTGTRESIKLRDYIKAADSRNELHRTLAKAANDIREQSLANSRKLYEEQQTASRNARERAAAIERECIEIIKQSESHIQQIEEIERTAARITKLREFGNRLSEGVRAARKVIQDKFKNAAEVIKNLIFKNEELENEAATYEMQKEWLSQEPTLQNAKEFEKKVSAAFKIDVEKKEMQQERQQSRGYEMSR